MTFPNTLYVARSIVRLAYISLYYTHLYSCYAHLNPLTAKLFNLNFHPLEIVSR